MDVDGTASSVEARIFGPLDPDHGRLSAGLTTALTGLATPLSSPPVTVCLCGDLSTRHRVGVRAGVPVRTSCKDCSCDGFEPCASDPLPAPAPQTPTAPTDRPQPMDAAPRRVHGPAVAAPAMPADPAGTGDCDGQLTALIAERFAPGPAGHSADDGLVRSALACRRPVSSRSSRRARSPRLEYALGGAK